MATARLVTSLLFLLAVAAPAAAEITDIRRFLDQCPQNDPAIAIIRADFQLRRYGVVIADLPPCTEPVSAMATAAYSDELIILQGLRAIYHMDRGMGGHLPWTDMSLYDWMKSRIGGINIVKGGTSYCCEYYGPTLHVPPPPPPPGQPPPQPPPPPWNYNKYIFIAVAEQDAQNRDFDRTWYGISGNIGLYAHEVRHVDGFSHASCCGIEGGCDERFDLRALSPYGLQWWLQRLWLNGTINVGVSCLPPVEAQALTRSLVADLNFGAARFCAPKPPQTIAPPAPFGRCYEWRRGRTVGRF